MQTIALIMVFTLLFIGVLAVLGVVVRELMR